MLHVRVRKMNTEQGRRTEQGYGEERLLGEYFRVIRLRDLRSWDREEQKEREEANAILSKERKAIQIVSTFICQMHIIEK